MSKKNRLMPPQPKSEPTITSLLEYMVDGREFESLVKRKAVQIDVATELRKSLLEIKEVRGNRPAICYLANVVKPRIEVPVSIEANDDLPFSEMISAVPSHEKAIDVILVTPGGSAQQVAKFVDKLRPRFDNVAFILPYMAMSAGTIFAMSGNDIIMGQNSYIGPTDPQVPNKDGLYVPAQTILALLDDIQKRGQALIDKGQNPQWSDMLILKHLDTKDIGNVLSASAYSMELVENYLYNFKFKDWRHHSDHRPVTNEEKMTRAKEIAQMLCSHVQWKTHSRGITRDVAWNECKIKITHSESVEKLDRAMRRFWALMYWVFENTTIVKAFASDNYLILRNDPSLMNKR